MEEEIQQLRKQGLTYKQISEQLHCAKSLISYYLNPKTRADTYQRTRNRRKRTPRITTKLETFKYVARQRLRKKLDGFHKQARRLPRKEQNFSIKDIIDKLSDSPKCYLTGDLIDLNSPNEFEFDHIIPTSKGGENSVDNLGLSTRDANRAKCDLTLPEFLDLCERVLRNFGKM